MRLTMGMAASKASAASRLARPNSHSRMAQRPCQRRMGQLNGRPGDSGGFERIGDGRASASAAWIGISSEAVMVTRSLFAGRGPARQAGPTRNLLSLKQVSMDTENCSYIPVDPGVWFPTHAYVGS